MANHSDHWALTDFSGHMPENAGSGAELFVLVDEIEIPIAQFSMSYGLNAIPTAMALVALGRDARTNQLSPIYALASRLKQMMPVRVEIRGNLGDWSPRGGTGGGKQKWPGGTHILFVGYVAGVSYRRSLGRVSLVLNMINQLFDLSSSSCGSTDLVPGAPHDLMLPTLTEGPGTKAVGEASGKFSEQLPADLNKDFSKGVLKALHYVAENNRIQTHDGATDTAWCSGPPAGASINKRDGNTRAIRAISGYAQWKGIANFVDSRYTKPYPLDIHATGNHYVAQKISEVISASFSGTSMWSMMIGSLLPEFGVAIVPTAQTAFMVPLLPMSKTSAKTLKSNDYVDFNLKTMSKRPLYGVGVMGNFNTATVTKDSEDGKQCVGATFTAEAEEVSDGMWLFVSAPRWMDDWNNFDPKAADGKSAVLNMLSKPSHDATGCPDPATDRNPDDEAPAWNDAMQKYAQMIYAQNALNGRQGTIVGKLRFDICPGTTILVQSEEELKSGGVDTLAVPLYALVAQVTVTINAEQASASTTFELTNIRTDVENGLKRFALDSHPFFKDNFFKSAPLVPSLEIT